MRVARADDTRIRAESSSTWSITIRTGPGGVFASVRPDLVADGPSSPSELVPTAVMV